MRAFITQRDNLLFYLEVSKCIDENDVPLLEVSAYKNGRCIDRMFVDRNNLTPYDVNQAINEMWAIEYMDYSFEGELNLLHLAPDDMAVTCEVMAEMECNQ